LVLAPREAGAVGFGAAGDTFADTFEQGGEPTDVDLVEGRVGRVGGHVGE
jgi:hypothetical protein